jgi:hypothetical protein
LLNRFWFPWHWAEVGQAAKGQLHAETCIAAVTCGPATRVLTFIKASAPTFGIGKLAEIQFCEIRGQCPGAEQHKAFFVCAEVFSIFLYVFYQVLGGFVAHMGKIDRGRVVQQPAQSQANLVDYGCAGDGSVWYMYYMPSKEREGWAPLQL